MVQVRNALTIIKAPPINVISIGTLSASLTSANFSSWRYLTMAEVSASGIRTSGSLRCFQAMRMRFKRPPVSVPSR